MILRIVLLPEPEGPSKATSCPAGTSNETSSTAWNDPNRFTRSLTRMLIGLGLTGREGIFEEGLGAGNGALSGALEIAACRMDGGVYVCPSRAALRRR